MTITTVYILSSEEFSSGPGYLSLEANASMEGPAHIEYLLNGTEWKRLYDSEGNPVTIGPFCETVGIPVPDISNWRIAIPVLTTDTNEDYGFSFYNADLDAPGDPLIVVDPPLGKAAGTAPCSSNTGVTTYEFEVDGAGVLCLTNAGHMAGRALLVAGNYSGIVDENGDAVLLAGEGDCVELKGSDYKYMVYQVPNCWPDDVEFTFTPVDYSGGWVTPVPIFIGVIPDLNLVQNVTMTPFDASVYFQTGGVVEEYTMTLEPDGLSMDYETGILSGTPTTISSYNPLVNGSNGSGDVDSNVFNIGVSSVVGAVDIPEPDKPKVTKKKTAKKKVAKKKVTKKKTSHKK